MLLLLVLMILVLQASLYKKEKLNLYCKILHLWILGGSIHFLKKTHLKIHFVINKKRYEMS